MLLWIFIGLGCGARYIPLLWTFADVRRVHPVVIFFTLVFSALPIFHGFLQSHPPKPERGFEQDH